MTRLDHMTAFYESNTQFSFAMKILFTYFRENGEKSHEATYLAMIPARFAEPEEESHLADYIRLHMYGRFGKPEMLAVPVNVVYDTFPEEPFKIRKYRFTWKDAKDNNHYKEIEAVNAETAWREFYETTKTLTYAESIEEI